MESKQPLWQKHFTAAVCAIALAGSLFAYKKTAIAPPVSLIYPSGSQSLLHQAKTKLIPLWKNFLAAEKTW